MILQAYISVADKTSVQLLKPSKTPPGLLSKLNDAISHKPWLSVRCWLCSLWSTGKVPLCARVTKRTLLPLCPVHMFHWGSCRKLPVRVAVTPACHTGNSSVWKPESDLPDSGWCSTISLSSTEKEAYFQVWMNLSEDRFGNSQRVLPSRYWWPTASLTTAEEELDERLREALQMEDPDLMVDLCELNKGHSDKFALLWEKMKVYLNDSSAVHEWWHSEVTYMAKAISARDLIQEVAKMCLGEPVPSEQWVCLQFCPRNPRARTASQYRSQFKVKMMVQKRQFRHHHVDAHYFAAIFVIWVSLPSLFGI